MRIRLFIAAVIGALLTLIMVNGSAVAATGVLSRSEMNNITWFYDGGLFGIPHSGDRQSTVENNCNCTGDLVGSWTDNHGTKIHNFLYTDGYETGGAGIWFIQLDDGHWYAWGGHYCDANGCDHYGNTGNP